MRPLTQALPKPMLPVGEKPFLEYILERLKEYGITHIVLCVGYRWQKIQKYFRDGRQWGMRIQYSVEETPLGTGGAIKHAASLLEEEFIVVNGDTYLEIDYHDFLAFYKKVKHPVIALTEVEHAERYGIVEHDNRHRIISFTEKGKGEGKHWINGGVYLFQKKVLASIPKGKVSVEREVFPVLAKKGLLSAYLCKGLFVDMGTPESYERAKKLFAKSVRT